MNRLRNGSFLLLLVVLWNSCGNTHVNENEHQRVHKLTAQEFANQIEKLQDIQLLDIRTPQEFDKGHIEGAINVDWNGSGFEEQIALLEKDSPVFVYCLSGGRSKHAVEKLVESGFTQIYELPGGIMEWRANKLPERVNKVELEGMTKQQYQNLIRSDKLVLVDFYADWCGPCKKMEPFLNRIAKDMAEDLLLVRIDADANPELCRELEVDALPYLKLYQAGNLKWEHLGFIGEQELRAKLEN